MTRAKHKKEDDDIEIVEEGEDRAEGRIDKLRTDLAACRKEKQEYLEGWQRAKADLINHKKDEAERKQALARFATEGMVHDILPVLDSFDLALKHAEGSDIEKGILMIRSQLEDVLRRKGAEVIPVRAGDPFDMMIHESVGETESDAPPGTVAEETQRGYRMHGKVIRASRVKLSKE
ncbi:MAG: nucleotide exchange factor GrpE [Candidatus Niyogibacteria bacterium CG10_big_fil_rev_8_21_14_0_10_46_36]|uniref:Protein GrpE n=1 Tax=Candidatus Niyogibacteria bacterium CG10_big_fil_rev_8_21_14_0_10_46_36 TaxID=1974726 RepID=A0A2H0TEA8_9BACT|nr:MAG: nucleotide exchange factor GrpE [Candidatus Niyogibacteria bacterium CG10_big_fil_rev_8_21_14_0_10_46_36]